MAFITDFLLINAADDPITDFTYGAWSLTLNSDQSNTPIYIEDVSCAWWPWSKGNTGGYAYCAASGSVASRLAIIWFNMAFADIANIPITQARLRLCSTNWTTNYAEWDMLAQIASPKNIPISGHTPIMVYPTNPDGSNGTFNPASLSQIGVIGNTGNGSDGKQGGFDMIFLISYVGAHSATFTQTFFNSLYAESYDSDGGGLPGTSERPLAVVSRSGTNFTFNSNIRLGHGTSDTANLVVTESNKNIFFNNIEPEQNLGYIFVDPNGSYTIDFVLNNVGHTWNEQDGTNPEIFDGAEHCAKFLVTGGAYARGGAIPLPPYISDALTYMTGATFDDCKPVYVGAFPFVANTVSGATVGSIYVGTGTRRAKDNTYKDNTDAVKVEAVQNLDIDGDKFSGNTYDIWFSGNCSTITAGSFIVGRAYKILTVGTTDFTLIGSDNNTIGTKFIATGVGTGTGTATEVLLINALNGANPTTYRATGTNGDVLINNPKTFKFTVSPSITGYEWRIYTVTALGSLAGAVEIAGEESATADNQTYAYNYAADQSIGVQIIPQPDEDYEESISYYTLKSAGQDISILLQEDINN